MIKFENKKNGRFYYLEIQEDLLKDKVLVAYRGGKFASVVRKMATGCDATIQKEIEKISKIRISHGYELVA